MDSSLVIRARQPLHKSHSPRSTAAARNAAATEVAPSQTSAATNPGSDRESQRDDRRHRRDEPKTATPVAEPLAGADSRAPAWATHEAGDCDLSNQSLMRLRAYSRPRAAAPAASTEPGTDIEV